MSLRQDNMVMKAGYLGSFEKLLQAPVWPTFSFSSYP